ncbi:hypothetical protein GCM10010112_48540 [Actinoplanes lobatus]|uniref:Uncharacterized protein n=1 Tax=Actinoplanes lobatus TaxID=113568 RepID=A0ABQ4AC08_9ACTN|nr:hypothetical protein GCM10010112_48540 [Actinoplanes lobatus]GIE38545.1 hypothetical protein Alo02nite_14430 [Actinoplanes lobatus]
MVAYLPYNGGARTCGDLRVRPPAPTGPRMTITVTGATAESGNPGAWPAPPQPTAHSDRRNGRERQPGCLASTTATNRPA